MIIINTVNSTRFSVDGIPYLKNYISEVAGNQITIFNAYDRKDVRVDWEHFGNITLNGVVYGNISDLQSALLPVIYTRNSLGGAVGIEDVFAGTNVTIDKTDPQNPIISATGGSMENVTQRIFTLTLSDIGATDFNDDIPAKIKNYAIANGIQKLPNETHDWEVIQDFNFYLRISGTDMYDNYGIEDKSTFVSYLSGYGATNIVVTDFYLSADTFRCNLSFDGALPLNSFGISKIINLDSLVNLTYLDLSENQLTKIENLETLVNLNALYLSYNQLTTIENLDALVNLDTLFLSYNQLTTTEFNKLNSWAILAPNNGTIYASNNTDNFNLSTTYTTLLAKGWTIYT